MKSMIAFIRKYVSIGALAGLALLVVVAGYYGVSKVWKWYHWVVLGLGLALVALYTVLRFQDVKRMFSLRSVRYGGNALAMSFLVLALLGGINFIANRHTLRLDFSAGKQYSLSDQTKNVLKNLKKDVQVTAFFQSENERRMADLLKSYRALSTRFQYEFVDPDKKPAVAKRYGITSYNTAVLECGGNVERITAQQEQDVTNALIKVTRDTKKVVYFLDGHGEANTEETADRTGYSSAKKAIENENYTVQKLNLAEKKSIPSDCAILIVAGPQKAFFPSELDSLRDYIDNGGKVFFLLDPDPSWGGAAFLAPYGVKVGNDAVLDVSGMGQLFGMGPAVPLVSAYESHPITSRFRVMTFFPYVRSVGPVDSPPSDVQVQSLLKTSESSWAESNVKELERKMARFDKNQDLMGPVSIGVVATREKDGKKSRLVVLGDSDFANNGYYGVQGNGDLFMNVVSWLAEEEDLISIRAKSPEDRRVFLTAQQSRLAMILTVILMPVAALGAGAFVYVRRGRR